MKPVVALFAALALSARTVQTHPVRRLVTPRHADPIIVAYLPRAPKPYGKQARRDARRGRPC